MNLSEKTDQLFKSLAAFQAEVPPIEKDATNPFLKNSYSTLAKTIETIKPYLAKHGLAVSQIPSQNGMTTILAHESGQWLVSTSPMPHQNGKGLSEAQNLGVVISYMRRYCLQSVLGLATEDNDGSYQEKPQPSKNIEVAKITEGQKEAIREHAQWLPDDKKAQALSWIERQPQPTASDAAKFIQKLKKSIN